MAKNPHSNAGYVGLIPGTLAWKIPWVEEPGRL